MHQARNAGGETVLVELEPVDAALLGPFGTLSEFLAHEQQLLARVRPLVGQQAAQPRRLRVVVARHPAPQGPLAVHDLVVADRQHEVLAERVEHREGDRVVVIAAVHRIATDVVERVVHPAHVPLHREAQAANGGRPGDARPRGRLLGDRDDPGRRLVGRGVHLLQELHGFKVLPAAVDVRRPATLRA